MNRELFYVTRLGVLRKENQASKNRENCRQQRQEKSASMYQQSFIGRIHHAFISELTEISVFVLVLQTSGQQNVTIQHVQNTLVYTVNEFFALSEIMAFLNFGFDVFSV